MKQMTKIAMSMPRQFLRLGAEATRSCHKQTARDYLKWTVKLRVNRQSTVIRHLFSELFLDLFVLRSPVTPSSRPQNALFTIHRVD